MFTADVAVDGPNEIQQDSSRMLAHSQGTFRGVVDFRINTTTAPEVGLSRAQKKTTKTTSRVYHMVPHCCSTCLFLDAQTRKKQKKRTTRTRIVQSISARTAVKIWTTEYLGIAREKSNPTLWNHIFKLRDTAVEVLRAHENCCRSFTLL